MTVLNTAEVDEVHGGDANGGDADPWYVPTPTWPVPEPGC